MPSNSTVSLSTTLDPLPPVLQRGLVAVAFFGILSLVSSLGLFTFLTYRLCAWKIRGQLRDGANQFLILIYNLVLADIQQAMAFSLTSSYLAENKIEVENNTTCWANGWFVSTGDLASGVFIFAIALHTFFAVVKGRRPSSRVFYSCIAGCWIFIYTMAIIGVGIDPKLYVRAGAWCWISHRHDPLRLWLHYLWIFICMFGTVLVYALIFLSIRTRSRLRLSARDTAQEHDPASMKRAAKYMIIYPVVYVICTLPLAGARMASMRGIVVPYWWFCLAGSAITSCGWLDVLLYAVTRRVLVFGDRPPPVDDLGLDTIGWKHSGDGFWGTTTTVTGPLGPHNVRRRGKTAGLGRLTPRLRHRHSDEDHLANHPEGVITTKTTVEVHTGNIPFYSESTELSVIESDDKIEGTTHSVRPSTFRE
ncbi:hypothetical protein PV08_08410 [Exophiala spinifera]|uniref:G-protein coupled receptors family 1 profile domain-containing protein n=1 Tax=Exophiala spinifera TaxID=91928 RepID=A0A0D2B2R5_9EURO|nr:uncharacterized protein PV08_08410 [Exophiala spinifera]KIW13223.1 hypothetical protein PV08_08410 [Exophiala spinifera]